MKRFAIAEKPGYHGILFGILVVLLISGSGHVITLVVAEINAAIASAMASESRWSKARSGAAMDLLLFADTSDGRYLEDARFNIDAMLALRRARVLLDADPPDVSAARREMLNSVRPKENVSRTIWFYRIFSKAPYYRDALASWTAMNASLDRLAQMPDEFRHAAQEPDRIALSKLRSELLLLNSQLRHLEVAYMDAHLRGASQLRNALFFLTTLGFAVLGVVVLLLLNTIIRRMRESEGNFRVVFDQAAIGMARMNATGRLEIVNQRLSQILCRNRDDVMQMRFDQLDGSGGYGDLVDLQSRLSLHPMEAIQQQHSFIRGDGMVVECKLTVSPLLSGAAAPQHWMVMIEDVSEAHRLAQELEHLANHDSLTGLINRREIRRLATHVLARSRRDQSFHALLLLDIDQFKLVNDSCGHAAGDDVLRQVAAQIAVTVGPRHALARLSGDEFAVLLEDTSLADAETVAERVLHAVRGVSFKYGTHSFVITASAGLAEISDAIPDINWAFRTADAACYLAKEQGRNRVRVYLDSDAAAAQRRSDFEWVAEIRSAIADHRIFLLAQRIRGLRDDNGLQFEVLMRMMDRKGQMHAPGAFMPAAEHYDQARALDEEVVRLTIDALLAHRAQLDRISLCHINISAKSIVSAGFREWLVKLVRQRGIPFEKLCFELNETSAIANLSEARAFIETLRKRGSKIALDDFGTGMSSFGYLKTLPVDILKIDGAFVRNCAEDVVDLSVLTAIAHVGRTQRKTTIATFVETAEVMKVLRGIDIDAAQGIAVDLPRPLDELLDELVATAT